MNNLSKSITYPNQRTVKIHREKATTDFLGIKNENWKAASRDLSAHALKLYMYLASNADNFELALSPAAILKEIGMARSTYHDQFHILENKGYIKHIKGNTYEFFEKPQPSHDNTTKEFSDGYDFTTDELPIPTAANSVLAEDIEINNNKSQNNIINSEKSPIVKPYEPKETVIYNKSPEAKGINRPKPIERKKPFSDF